MKRIFVCIAFLSSLSFAQAHQTNSATTIIVQQNNKWLLQVRASLTAFQYEIRTHFADTPYETPEQFQDFVIEYAQKNISATFDEKNIATLGNPYIKLGHETILVFELKGVPTDFEKVKVTNSCFKDIHRNQNTLIIMQEGFSREYFILDNDNQHSGSLMAEHLKKKEIAIATTSNNLIAYAMGFGLFIVFGLSLFIYQRRAKRAF